MPTRHPLPSVRRAAALAALVASLFLPAGAARAQSPAAPAAPGPLAAAEPALPGLGAVLGELRRGGLVIYFRHGATETVSVSEAEVDIDHCEAQRNLSAQGRQQFARIGEAFRRLGIPVDTVVSSPFCRCKDSAALAFGRYSIDRDLSFAVDADAEQSRRLADALRQRLGTPPAPGRNAVIVAHTANLREAARLWPKPEGAAFVFRPLPGGQFEPVARIHPDDWTR